MDNSVDYGPARSLFRIPGRASFPTTISSYDGTNANVSPSIMDTFTNPIGCLTYNTQQNMGQWLYQQQNHNETLFFPGQFEQSNFARPNLNETEVSSAFGCSSTGTSGSGDGSSNFGPTGSFLFNRTELDSMCRWEGNEEAALPKKKVYKRKVRTTPKRKIFGGYFIYLRERYGQLRSMYPEMHISRINHYVSKEWRRIDRHLKQKYLDSAIIQKRNYQREMGVFMKAETTKGKGISAKKNQLNHDQTGPRNNPLDMNISGGGRSFGADADVKIGDLPGSDSMNMVNGASVHLGSDNAAVEMLNHTEEFIAHDNVYELELFTLRKTVAMYQLHSATLQKQVQEMRAKMDCMQCEMDQLKVHNLMCETTPQCPFPYFYSNSVLAGDSEAEKKYLYCSI